MIAAFFTFGGWWDASKVASEVKDSTRNMRRALVLGVSIVTLVYLVISLEFFYLVSESRTLSKGGFAAAAGAALFGTAGSVVFAWIVLVCVLGSMLAIGIAAPRAYFAMAKDGLFLPGVAVMSKRLGTPARAIALEALIACLYVAFAGTFEQMLAFFVAPMIIFLAMVVGSVYRFGGSSKDGPEFAIPGYPLTPLLFIVPSLCLVPLLVLENPQRGNWLRTGCAWLACILADRSSPRRENKPRLDVSNPGDLRKVARPDHFVSTSPDACRWRAGCAGKWPWRCFVRRLPAACPGFSVDGRAGCG